MKSLLTFFGFAALSCAQEFSRYDFDMNKIDVHVSKPGEEGEENVVDLGSKVKVHYTGRLEDGTVFDSSKGRQPFEFTLGGNTVINCWDYGMRGLTKGMHATITCPADRAYGDRGNGLIPPDAWLQFDVEILETHRQIRQLKVKPLNEGHGPLIPKHAEVEVWYTGKFVDGRVFDTNIGKPKPLKFVVGKSRVIDCWDKLLLELKKGQKAILECPFYEAYGREGKGQTIPGSTDLIFEVEIVDFKPPKEGL